MMFSHELGDADEDRGKKILGMADSGILGAQLYGKTHR